MKKCKLLKIALIIAFILANFLSFSPATISAGDDSFAKIIAGIGANETTLTISNEQNITADTTVPSNITLMFMQGGSLAISADKTVTINGHVDAGLYQIFSGAGSVSFGVGSVKEAYPQWWGAIGLAAADQSKDHTSAIQAMLNSGVDKGVIPDGYYMIDADTVQPGKVRPGLSIPSNFELVLGANTVLQALNMDENPRYSIFIIYNQTNVIIKANGATLIGDSDNVANKTLTPSTLGINLRILGSSDVWVYDLVTKKSWGEGVYIGYDDMNSPYPESENVNLINCRATENYRNGIAIVGAIGGGIFGGSCDNNSGTAPQDGIDIEPSPDNGSGNPSVVQNFIIDGVKLYNNAAAGVEVRKASSTNTIITNCNVYDNLGGGVNILGAAKTTINNCKTYSNTDAGFSTSDADGVVVIGMQSYLNGAGAYLLRTTTGPLQDILIEGGSFYDNTGIGIYVLGTATRLVTRITVKGVVIGENGSEGLLVDYINDSKILNNYFYDNGKFGLKTVRTHDSIVSGNHSYANGINTDVTYDNFNVTYCTNIIFSQNIAEVGTNVNTPRCGLMEYNNIDISVINNDFTTGGTTSNASVSSAGTIVKNNISFVSENCGISTAIATGATVAHGLVMTPTYVNVTAAEVGPTDITVTAVGAATFVVNFGGGGNKTFYWEAVKKW